MSPKVKLITYAVLLILAVWFGLAFRSNYAAVAKAAAEEGSDTTSSNTSQPTPTNTDTSAPTPTNTVTNVTDQATNVADQSTNATADVTNSPAGTTNAATAVTGTNAPSSAPPPSPPATTAVASAPPPRAAMIGYLGALIVVLIGLGVMVAIDVTQIIGEQASNYLFFDVGDAMRDPDYEKAEGEWANGKFLEAVQLLRDYLKKNPREVHAALRIAEIYEKDLKNYVASALEYEEVLKKKLPAERWGWAAIHLCNLYSKLKQQDKTLALLHRIVDEYPRTAAARKARARLGIAEPEETHAPTEPVVETIEEPTDETLAQTYEVDPETVEDEPPAPPEPPKSNLPPGFRPKG